MISNSKKIDVQFGRFQHVLEVREEGGGLFRGTEKKLFA